MVVVSKLLACSPLHDPTVTKISYCIQQICNFFSFHLGSCTMSKIASRKQSSSWSMRSQNTPPKQLNKVGFMDEWLGSKPKIMLYCEHVSYHQPNGLDV